MKDFHIVLFALLVLSTSSLNVWRSAINRYLEDHGTRRQLLGTSVNAVIKTYKSLQLMRKLARGEEPDLHRVSARR